MISLKTLKPQHYYKLLKHQNPLLISKPFFKLHEFVFGVESNSVLPTSFTQRRGFTSEDHDLMKRGMKKMKSLDVLFKEAVGLNEKIEGESWDSEEEEEDNELKKKLKKIEKEVKMMKGNVKEKGKKKNTLKKKKKETVLVEKEKSVAGLYTLFISILKKPHSLFAENDDCEKKQEGKEFSIKLRPMKELSPELISPVKLLVEEGYLNEKIEGESGDSEEEEEDNELKKKLKKIEKEVKMMKGHVKEKGRKKSTLKKKKKKKKKETVLVEKEKPVAGLYTLFKSIPKKPHSLLAENDDCKKKQEGKEFSIKSRPMKELSPELKSLDVLFKEEVGLNEKIEGESCDSEEEDYELKKKFKKMEKEVKLKKGNVKEKGKKKNILKKKKKETVLVEKEKSVAGLYTLFKSIPKKPHSLLAENDDCEKKQEGKEFSIKLRPMKEFSPELISLVKLLVEEGYLNDANFLPRTKEFDLDCFSTLYSRDFVKARAERLGKDHPEITKCLSEIEIKRLALFGCPSVDKKTAFAAKRLRSYFDIQENIVCRACKLNSSCKVKFHTVGKKYGTMDLADVIKILSLYSLELVPSELTIPDETKESINILLKQVVDHFQ